MIKLGGVLEGILGAVLCLTMLMPVSYAATAEIAETTEQRFYPVDSGKDLEGEIAVLLKQKLKIKTSLAIVNDDPDNMRVRMMFAPNPEKGLPKVLVSADTRIVTRDQNKQVLSQNIVFSSVADVVIDSDRLPDLMKFTNVWNSKMMDVRLYVGGNKLIAASQLLVGKTHGVLQEQVLAKFLGVVRAWPVITRELKRNDLIKGAANDAKP